MMSLNGKFEISSLSDVGQKRTHNEDSVGTEIDIGIKQAELRVLLPLIQSVVNSLTA